VSFPAISLYIASQRVFSVDVVYSVIDSVRKRLDTPSWRTHSVKSVMVTFLCRRHP